MKGTLKKYKCKGKGDYQDLLESITEFKVIQKIAIKPFTYELLRQETKIHRNKLREILDNFTKIKITIPHKYRFIDNAINGYENIKIKTGLEHYILDLDNEYTLEYLRDVKLDTKIKDFIIDYKFIYAPNPIRFATKNKRILTFSDRDMRIVELNKVIQCIKIATNFNPSFSLIPYLLSEQIDDYKSQKYSFLTRLKETRYRDYLAYMKVLDEYRIKHENNNFTQYKKQKEIDEYTIKNLLKYCSIRGLSRFDLLILLSWSFPSQENYLKFWNIIKYYNN